MGLRETAGSFFTSPLPLLPGHVEVHIVWFSDTGLCVTGALGFAVAHLPRRPAHTIETSMAAGGE